MQVNGHIRFEGVLKIYWGLKKSIKLAPGVLYAKARNSRDSLVVVAPEGGGVGPRQRQRQAANGWDSSTGQWMILYVLYSREMWR